MPRRVYPSLVAFFKEPEHKQTQVADELGISEPFLSMIKWGEREPSLGLAMKISERCNVPLESLLLPRNGKKKAS